MIYVAYCRDLDKLTTELGKLYAEKRVTEKQLLPYFGMSNLGRIKEYALKLVRLCDCIVDVEQQMTNRETQYRCELAVTNLREAGYMVSISK